MSITKIPAPTSTAMGTVTSVGLSLPTSVFDVTGSPVTGAGTLTAAFDTQSANTVFAGPTNGAAATPAFRALVAADVPSGFIKGTAAVTAGIPFQNGTADTVVTNAALTWLPDTTGVTVLTRVAAGSPAAAVGLSVVAPTGGVANYAATFTGGNIGIRTSTPGFDLTFGGNAARVAGMERHSTADTVGSTLTVNAGGATVGATNKAGGTLILAPGVSTGSATAGITLQVYPGAAASTTDNTIQTAMTLTNAGVVIPTRAVSGTPATTFGLDVSALTGGTANYGAVFRTGNVGIGVITPSVALVIGDDLGSGGMVARSSFIVANTSAGSSFALGQSGGNQLNIRWAYNATPANALATINTFGYSNPIQVDGSYISLQTNSGGKVGIGTNSPNGKLDVVVGTLTGTSTPAFSSTATWNNVGTTFVNNFMNVTDTTSAAGSLLAQWQLGGSDRFKVSKTGIATASSAVVTSTIYTVSTLPTGVEGMRAAVSDALTPAFLGILVGGGAVHVPAYYNGTNWIAG